MVGEWKSACLLYLCFATKEGFLLLKFSFTSSSMTALFFASCFASPVFVKAVNSLSSTRFSRTLHNHCQWEAGQLWFDSELLLCVQWHPLCLHPHRLGGSIVMCMACQHHSKQLTVAGTLTGSKWQQIQVQELVRVCLDLPHLACSMIIQMPLVTFRMSLVNRGLPGSGVYYKEWTKLNVHVPCHGMFDITCICAGCLLVSTLTSQKWKRGSRYKLHHHTMCYLLI